MRKKKGERAGNYVCEAAWRVWPKKEGSHREVMMPGTNPLTSFIIHLPLVQVSGSW
jgi:hypothetical protein